MGSKEILTKNTEEVVTDEELDEILEMDESSAYVGYETSGPVHLGHWISVRKLLDVDRIGMKPKVLWADKHTYLNKKGDENWERDETRRWIEDMTDYWQATFEELGLRDAEFVRGSEFQRTEDYKMDFEDLSTKVTRKRAENAIGDVASDQESPYVSQDMYPIYQALDIAHLDVDLAIGGIDQRKIHMLARDELPKIGYDAPTSMHLPLLTSLKGTEEKMSSSKPQTMFPLHASEEVVRERINGAYCTPDVEEDLVTENPLLQISKYFVFGADEELEISRPEEYGGDLRYADFEELKQDFADGSLHPADMKGGVADYVADRLSPVRERFRDEPGLLEPLSKAGYGLPDYVEE